MQACKKIMYEKSVSKISFTQFLSVISELSNRYIIKTVRKSMKKKTSFHRFEGVENEGSSFQVDFLPIF